MIIAITGATGFIGTYLKRSFDSADRIVEVDLHRNSLDEFNFGGCDVLIHLAGIAHITGRVDDSLYFNVNRDLAYNVAQKAKLEGVKQFIFMSTAKVYGDSSKQNEYFDESSKCNPTNAYGRSKLEAESLIKSLSNDNFKVAIIRSPLVYGEGVKANMFSIIKLTDKFCVLPFAGINNKRSMVYVGNLVELIKTIVEQPQTGTFLPTDGQPISTNELTQQIAISLKKKRRFIAIPHFLLNIMRLLLPKYYDKLCCSFVLNSKDTNNKLGLQAMPYTFAQGVDMTVKWYQKNKSRK